MIARSNAWTVGLAGAAGRPNGVTDAPAGLHGPTPSAVTTATSQLYVVPLATPSMVVFGSSDSPSSDSIQSPSPARQRTR